MKSFLTLFAFALTSICYSQSNQPIVYSATQFNSDLKITTRKEPYGNTYFQNGTLILETNSKKILKVKGTIDVTTICGTQKKLDFTTHITRNPVNHLSIRA